MELKLNIRYEELLNLLKQLPASQIRKLMADLALLVNRRKEKREFQQFLLEAPVMDDDQYQEFLANRKHFNAWRTK